LSHGKRIDMEVGELMNKDAFSVELETSIADVAQLMKRTGANCLVVMENEEIEGIITDRDMALGCLVDGHTSWKCSDYRHMALQHLTVSPTLHYADASIMMIDRDLEHLPVVEGGELVGLLSSEEVLAAVDRDVTLSAV
tara:strand:- start:4267 stop:4683 length:417 start_codon:yes stop_codon:yes gene_type:complete